MQNALNSIQQLDRAIDRFLGWLTETESNLDALELEANKLGDRSLRQRNWFEQIKVCLSLQFTPVSYDIHFLSFVFILYISFTLILLKQVINIQIKIVLKSIIA